MTLDKVIEILTIDNEHNPDFTDADRRKAHQLSIEAVKAWKQFQESLPPQLRSLLPGETKE